MKSRPNSHNYRGKPQKTTRALVFVLGFALPLALLGLFWVMRNNTELMERWATKYVRPVAQFLATITAVVPFAVGEIVLLLAILLALIWVVYRIKFAKKYGQSLVTKLHLKIGFSLCLWALVWLTWAWNALYYVPSFASRANLEIPPYSVETLAATTAYYAQRTANLSDQIPRDDQGNLGTARADYFKSATQLYQRLQKDYPFLSGVSVVAKPLLLSRVQSYFGFSGMYNPYTGEATINIDTPAVLHPVTIAHEMAHQRSIAPEQEANFLAVIACLQSDDVVFEYSGALFGLMQLSNALSSADQTLWGEIVEQYFTPELYHDWNTTVAYWQQFESPVKEVSHQAYDEFLKSNDQDLGMQSYGACVDLLVAFSQKP